jgi:hypothetical protein
MSNYRSQYVFVNLNPSTTTEKANSDTRSGNDISNYEYQFSNGREFF